MGLRLSLGLFVLTALAGPVIAVSDGQTSRPASGPAEPASVLRMARSPDGLVFKDSGEVVLENASAPAMVRLPNGHLLAICDLATDAGRGETVMAVSRSADEGARWTPPQPIRLAGPGSSLVRGRHGVLAWMPDGLLRLYFVAGGTQRGGRDKSESARPASQPFEATAVLSALSRDGLQYKLDREAGPIADERADLRLSVMTGGDRVHLFLDDASRPDSARPHPVMHLVSRDGRRFQGVEPLSIRGVCFAGGVVPVDKRFRAYVSGDDGIRSLVSGDGSRWIADDGVRLVGGREPAVVQLRDGTFLMLYHAEASARSRGLGAATSGPAEARSLGAVGESPGASAGDQAGGAVVWEPFASESAETPGGGSLPEPVRERTAQEAGSQQQASADQTGDSQGEFFPPKPDFRTRVDYWEWLKQQYPSDIEDNAYNAYGALHLPDELNDMFNSTYNGPIIPWVPAQHPEWEATHNSVQGLLDQFRQVTRRDRYVCPLTPSGAESSPDGEAPLFNLLLPSLAEHRALNKAMMADAWRAENGQVDPAGMADAFETCLRSANHMEQGYTLIHHLVGMAEQGLVERNALKALEQNVFKSPEQMESALKVLRERDRYDGQSAGWIPFEHASAMDEFQYVFMPADRGGQPRANPDRVRSVLRTLNGTEPSQQDLDTAARLKPEVVRQAVDAYDAFYRELAEKWRTGYPQVRTADIKALNDRHLQVNDITRAFPPNFEGAYRSVARNEASRRATQLTYEVHLFRASNGRWPSSLDELPARPGSNSHTDPFTGGGFGYKLTESGPRIYTAGEDGQDNGGAHSDDIRQEGTDYVFWPPQK